MNERARREDRSTGRGVQSTADEGAQRSAIDSIHAVHGRLGNTRIQSLADDLEVAPSTDPAEREADRLARTALESPAAGATAPSAEDNLTDARSVDATPPGVRGMLGPATALSDRLAAFFEPRFGTDLSGVRIHQDERAAAMTSAIDARAFTVGSHIAFATDAYDPTSRRGRHLIAHELAHVVSNRAGDTTQRIYRWSGFDIPFSSESEVDDEELPEVEDLEGLWEELDLAGQGLGTFADFHQGLEDGIKSWRAMLAVIDFVSYSHDFGTDEFRMWRAIRRDFYDTLFDDDVTNAVRLSQDLKDAAEVAGDVASAVEMLTDLATIFEEMSEISTADFYDDPQGVARTFDSTFRRLGGVFENIPVGQSPILGWYWDFMQNLGKANFFENMFTMMRDRRGAQAAGMDLANEEWRRLHDRSHPDHPLYEEPADDDISYAELREQYLVLIDGAVDAEEYATAIELLDRAVEIQWEEVTGRDADDPVYERARELLATAKRQWEAAEEASSRIPFVGDDAPEQYFVHHLRRAFVMISRLEEKTIRFGFQEHLDAIEAMVNRTDAEADLSERYDRQARREQRAEQRRAEELAMLESLPTWDEVRSIGPGESRLEYRSDIASTGLRIDASSLRLRDAGDGVEIDAIVGNPPVRGDFDFEYDSVTILGRADASEFYESVDRPILTHQEDAPRTTGIRPGQASIREETVVEYEDVSIADRWTTTVSFDLPYEDVAYVDLAIFGEIAVDGDGTPVTVKSSRIQL